MSAQLWSKRAHLTIFQDLNDPITRSVPI